MHASHTDRSNTTSDPVVVGYRPVSTLAAAALVLGVSSALALVSPLFFVVPLVAVAVAVAGLVDVERDGATKAGRLAAVAGLALAVGFGSQALSSGVVARWIAAGRATAAADVFLRAVREGRLVDAETMCGPEARGRVAALAKCIGDGTSMRAQPGDEAGTWTVEIVPGVGGGCGARIVLVPTDAGQQGRSIERWIVTSCDAQGATITPSAT